MTVSPELRARVIAMLREGYGVDDIRLALCRHPDVIAAVVADLRAAGTFRQPGFFAVSPRFQGSAAVGA